MNTGAHARVSDAVAELADIRARLAREIACHGLAAGVAAMHPSALWSQTVLSAHPRRRDIAASMRVLARREPTVATHVQAAAERGHALAVGVAGRLVALIAVHRVAPPVELRGAGGGVRRHAP